MAAPLETHQRSESSRSRIPAVPLPPIDHSEDAPTLPAGFPSGLALHFAGDGPHARRNHSAIYSLDIIREDDASAAVKIQLTAGNFTTVNRGDLQDWIGQRVEQLPESIANKKLDLTVEVQADYWDKIHGHDVVGMLLTWGMDRIRSLEVLLLTTYSGRPLDLGIRRGASLRLPSLESLLWTGTMSREFLSAVPFDQLTTVKLFRSNLSLDDCMEVLYRCDQIVDFSNFDPSDSDPVSLIISPPPHLAQLSIIQPHTHKQRPDRVKIPRLTSLSISFSDITMLFDNFVFPRLETLRIRVASDAQQRLEALQIGWNQLSKLVIYANLTENSARRIFEKCEANHGIKHHYECLDGTIIFRSGLADDIV